MSRPFLQTMNKKRINTKAKGTRNEKKSMKIFEAAGYACTKSAASLGVFDFIGISASDFVLVQVKSNDWPGSMEMEQIKNFACPPNARKLVHRWRDRVTTPDVREV